MLNFMVNAEGGLTTAGYAICIVLGIVVSDCWQSSVCSTFGL